MRLRRVIVAALAIAGVPLAVLLVLAATRALAVGAALAAAATVIGAGLVLAFLWTRDLDRLADAVRRPAAGDADPFSAAPVLPQVERIGREIELLSRTLADRAALVERMRRADEMIVERLPDPLIVLGADAP